MTMHEPLILPVGTDADGMRLDAFLAETLDAFTRNAAQRLILGGFVTSRGRALKKNHVLTEGEVLHVCMPEPETAEAVPQDILLDVVFEDGDVIAVNKPRGMVVHPAPGHPDGTLVNALLFHCGTSLSGVGGQIRPGIVHRIDKDTSGLLIAAKNDEAHRALAAQLKDHSLSRIYQAVACGRFRDDAGTVDAAIGRHPADRKRMAVTAKNGREAVTHYRVLARYQGYTHIECTLETGRTHQIRVHMASIGHPLLGDLTYGRKKPELGLAGQCLHAGTLRFRHPRSGAEISLTAPLPAYFTDILARLRPEL